MTEIWRDIPGYIGSYQASSEGRIRSLCVVHPDQVMSGVRLQKRVLSPGKGYAGRLGVSLCVYGVPKRFQVHRLVLMAFKGVPVEDLDGLHNDNNHLNNRPENLRWGTHTENMHDKWQHGTMPQGEKHSNAKLTEDQVRAIRLDIRTSRAIAAEFNISQVAVVFIKNRKTWKHVA
jgi:hypothetical protein